MITLMGKLMMMKNKQVPSTYNMETLREDTLHFLLPGWDQLDPFTQRDLFDFFLNAI